MEVSFSFRAPNQGEESMFLHSVLKWMQNSRVSHHHKLAASLVTARLQKKPIWESSLMWNNTDNALHLKCEPSTEGEG